MVKKMKEMIKKMNKKQLIMVATIIPILIVALILIINVSYSVDKDESNLGINKEQIVEGIKVSEGIIIQDKDLYTYSAKVTNTNKEKTHVEYLTFVFEDKDNKRIITLYGYVGKDLEENESVPVLASVDKDISNASKVEIEVKK